MCILNEAFKKSEPEITNKIRAIYAICPSIFTTLLPYSEQVSLGEEEVESRISIMANSIHDI